MTTQGACTGESADDGPYLLHLQAQGLQQLHCGLQTGRPLPRWLWRCCTVCLAHEEGVVVCGPAVSQAGLLLRRVGAGSSKISCKAAISLQLHPRVTSDTGRAAFQAMQCLPSAHRHVVSMSAGRAGWCTRLQHCAPLRGASVSCGRQSLLQQKCALTQAASRLQAAPEGQSLLSSPAVLHCQPSSAPLCRAEGRWLTAPESLGPGCSACS